MEKSLLCDNESELRLFIIHIIERREGKEIRRYISFGSKNNTGIKCGEHAHTACCTYETALRNSPPHETNKKIETTGGR